MALAAIHKVLRIGRHFDNYWQVWELVVRSVHWDDKELINDENVTWALHSANELETTGVFVAFYDVEVVGVKDEEGKN